MIRSSAVCGFPHRLSRLPVEAFAIDFDFRRICDLISGAGQPTVEDSEPGVRAPAELRRNPKPPGMCPMYGIKRCHCSGIPAPLSGTHRSLSPAMRRALPLMICGGSRLVSSFSFGLVQSCLPEYPANLPPRRDPAHSPRFGPPCARFRAELRKGELP